jgi:hypothetical protein
MPTKKRKHTDLFLLRVWYDEEERDDGSGVRWRGRLQRPTSGEARTFADWAALIAVLEAMLDQGQPEQVPNENPPGIQIDALSERPI